MKQTLCLVVFFFLRSVEAYEDKPGEPHCYSRFDYEYKVLQRLIQLEEDKRRHEDKLKSCEDDSLKQRLSQLEMGQLEFNATLSEVKAHGSVELNAAKGPFVAFSAYIDTTTALADKTAFNKVLVNKGLETPPYDVTCGVFTCPVSGFYLISIVVAVRGSGESWAFVKHNGDVLMDAVIEGGGNSSQDLQGGNMAVVRLSKGDEVWVSGSGTLPGNSGGYSDTRTSSFTGVLLHPTE